MQSENEIKIGLLGNEYDEKKRKKSVRNNIFFVIGAIIICM